MEFDRKPPKYISPIDRKLTEWIVANQISRPGSKVIGNHLRQELEYEQEIERRESWTLAGCWRQWQEEMKYEDPGDPLPGSAVDELPRLIAYFGGDTGTEDILWAAKTEDR